MSAHGRGINPQGQRRAMRAPGAPGRRQSETTLYDLPSVVAKLVANGDRFG